MNRYKKLFLGLILIAFLFLIGRAIAFYEIYPKPTGLFIADLSRQLTPEPAGNSQEPTSDSSDHKNVEAEDDTDNLTNVEVMVGGIEKDVKDEPVILQEAKMFYYEEISQEIKDRIVGKSYGKDCDVPYEELRYVKVLHWGFDGQTHTGELIVNKAIAKDIVEIFEELYEEKYPIERMVLVDEYDADDNVSMADNNSSAFNYRVIDGTNKISLHSYGLAIDINPKYNPYVREMDGKTIVTPVNGAEYADRSLDCEYYIKEGDVCYQAFIKRGFTWGGEWKSQKDYQHFQKKPD